MDRTIKVSLSAKEINALLLVISNGYGDGDFEEWMDRPTSAALNRGWDKLRDAAVSFERANKEEDKNQ